MCSCLFSSFLVFACLFLINVIARPILQNAHVCIFMSMFMFLSLLLFPENSCAASQGVFARFSFVRSPAVLAAQAGHRGALQSRRSRQLRLPAARDLALPVIQMFLSFLSVLLLFIFCACMHSDSVLSCPSKQAFVLFPNSPTHIQICMSFHFFISFFLSRRAHADGQDRGRHCSHQRSQDYRPARRVLRYVPVAPPDEITTIMIQRSQPFHRCCVQPNTKHKIILCYTFCSLMKQCEI